MKKLPNRIHTLPNPKVMTLPHGPPLVDKITKQLELFGWESAVKYAAKHNVPPKLVALINWRHFHTCLFCRRWFYTCELAGMTHLDNRHLFCTRGCRDDWNLNLMEEVAKHERTAKALADLLVTTKKLTNRLKPVIDI